PTGGTTETSAHLRRCKRKTTPSDRRSSNPQFPGQIRLCPATRCNAFARENTCVPYKSCVAYNLRLEESPKAGRSSWDRSRLPPPQQPPPAHSRTPDHA